MKMDDQRQSDRSAASVLLRGMVLLVTTHILICLISGIVSSDKPDPSTCILFGVLFSQLALLGVWCGLASTPPMVVRIPIALLAFAALSYWLCCCIDEFDEVLVAVCAIPTLLNFVATLVMRPFVRLVSLHTYKGEIESNEVRFSIKQILTLTTSMAVMLAAGRILHPYASSVRVASEVVVIGIGYSLLGVCVLWATLGKETLLRSLVFGAITTGVAWMVYVGMRDSNSLFFAWSVGLQALFMYVTMRIVRLIGIRVARRQVS